MPTRRKRLPKRPTAAVKTFAPRLAQVELDLNEAKFFSEPVGTIVGPYTKNGQLQVAQVLERTMVPDEAAKCRHILLSAKNAKDEAEMAALGARADS